MVAKKHDDKSQADLVGEKKQDASVQDAAAEEQAKDALKDEAALDTGTKSDAEPVGARWIGSDEIQMFAYILDTGLQGLEKAIDKKDGIPEDKIAGLLILERNGQNRTEYVKAMMKRLGIKDLKKELPQAGGPDYTNDQTLITDL